MAVYQSRFATRGIKPRTGIELGATKKVAVFLGITALLAAGAFGLWRATLGIPEPGPLEPGAITIID